MEVLLDTHVWIWWTLQKKSLLSNKATRALAQSSQKWISAISCWELAKLIEKKRISFSIPTLVWIRRSLHELNIDVTPLSPEIAVASTELADLHSDPADQMIVATSRIVGIPLVTADKRLHGFSGVETIW